MPRRARSSSRGSTTPRGYRSRTTARACRRLPLVRREEHHATVPVRVRAVLHVVRAQQPYGDGGRAQRGAGTTPTAATASIAVTNTGQRAGAAVPQMYIAAPAATGEPPKQLEGFSHLDLQAGQSVRTSFAITQRALSYWSAASHSWQVSRGCYTVMVGSDERDIAAHVVIAVNGASCPGAATRVTIAPASAAGCAAPRGRLSGFASGARRARNDPGQDRAAAQRARPSRAARHGLLLPGRHRRSTRRLSVGAAAGGAAAASTPCRAQPRCPAADRQPGLRPQRRPPRRLAGLGARAICGRRSPTRSGTTTGISRAPGGCAACSRCKPDTCWRSGSPMAGWS